MMKRSLIIVITVVVVVSIIAGSTYFYTSGDHFKKSQFVNVSGSSSTYYVNPFNNSTSTPFVVNFTLNNYSGGPIAFIPSIGVNSSVTNVSQSSDIWNLTTTTHNSSLATPYWSVFYLNVLVTPDTSNPGYGNFNYFQPQTGSTGIGIAVILWNQSSGDNLSVLMSSINIPSGNYSVSVLMKFQSHQPSQTYLNLTNGSAWVNLKSLQIVSQTTLNGGFSVSNLNISNKG